jgi:hypothetical protein
VLGIRSSTGGSYTECLDSAFEAGLEADFDAGFEGAFDGVLDTGFSRAAVKSVDDALD